MSRGIISNINETEEQSKMRFQTELEFVQCLANPSYLNYLAQRGTMLDQNFVNYLKYLQYWRHPEYAKFIKYPQCLHMLSLLQWEHFRNELRDSKCSRFIEDQQLLHWQHYTRTRAQLLNDQAELVNNNLTQQNATKQQ